jgi:hypothetical protein
MILNIPGGVFVSWLVSLSSEAIMGFIVQGQCVSLFSPPSFLRSLTICFPSFLFPDPVSSTSLIYFIQYSPSFASSSIDQRLYLLNSGLIR